MNQRELAEALGVGPAVVTRLKGRGMPVHSVEAAREWRLAHGSRHRVPKAPCLEPRGGTPAVAGSMSAQLLEAKLRHELADAFIADKQARLLAGKLVKADDVRMAHAARVAAARDAFRGLPARLGALLAAESDQQAVERMLMTEINAALRSFVAQSDAMGAIDVEA